MRFGPMSLDLFLSELFVPVGADLGMYDQLSTR